MRLYLSAPMSGKPAFNIPALDAEAEVLRACGHDVVSPAELDDPTFRTLCLGCKNGTMEELHELCRLEGIKPDTWGDLLARDVKLLADDGIEAIVVLGGWEDSRGATLEVYVGRLCGLPILYPDLGRVDRATLEKVHARATLPFTWPDLSNFPPLDTAESVQADQEMTPTERADSIAYDSEIRVVDPDTGGAKGAKDAVLGDLCPKALMQVATVAGFGRHKYSRLNYLKGYAWSLSYDALQRHAHAFWGKEDTDPESGLLHAAHLAWHALALLAFQIRGLGKDDRP